MVYLAMRPFLPHRHPSTGENIAACFHICVSLTKCVTVTSLTGKYLFNEKLPNIPKNDMKCTKYNKLLNILLVSLFLCNNTLFYLRNITNL